MTPVEALALFGPLLIKHGPAIVEALLDMLHFIRNGQEFMVVPRPKPMAIDERMDAIDRRVALEGKSVAEVNMLNAAEDQKEYLDGEDT